jgi:hypothetical protein
METKKMTLAEAQNYVKNTKYIVWSEDESMRLQKKLFEIGCKWIHSGKSICHTTETFLLVDNNLNVRFEIKECYECFEKSTYRYEQAENIISIEIEQEPKQQPKPKFDPNTLKPFDKVLVRDNVNNVWKARFFDRYFCKQFLTTDGLVYNYCIPYNDETKYLHGEIDEAPEFYKQD